MEHCGIWNRCILGVVNKVNYILCHIRQFQVAQALVSSHKMFILENTWMDIRSIRDDFEKDMFSFRLFSDTEWHILFICIEIIKALSIIWNVLALAVLLQAKFRKRGINIYLASLCAVILLDTGVKLFLELTLATNVSLLDAIPYLCPVMEVTQTMMLTLIAMLVTAINVERYVAIVHPFSRLADISPKTVLKVGGFNIKMLPHQYMTPQLRRQDGNPYQ